MKNAIIGGFFLLTGSLWLLSTVLFALINPVTAWTTPPGRFLTTLFTTGIAPFCVFGAALMAAGLTILVCELLKKDA